MRHGSRLLPDDTGYLIPSTCLDLDRYDLHNDASVKGVLQRLDHVATHDPARLPSLEINFGYFYCPNNVFNDIHLNIGLTSILVYDWMHIYFVGGVYCRELRALLGGIGSSQLRGWCFE